MHDEGSYFGCWVWTGPKTGEGYGALFQNGVHRYVHRLAYESAVGPIPEGHLLHHTCVNRACYNPAHLEPHTHATHPDHAAQRERSKTHCANGHPFDAANTYVNRHGHRKCRACRRDSMSRHRSMRKERHDQG